MFQLMEYIRAFRRFLFVQLLLLIAHALESLVDLLDLFVDAMLELIDASCMALWRFIWAILH